MNVAGQITTARHQKKSTHTNRNRFSCRTRFVFVLMLSLLCIAVTSTSRRGLAMNDFVNDEPFLAQVSNANACLRSGPGDDYYATNVLEMGQMLEVYYVVDDQWCAVRPPMGSFTWVDARNVRLGDNQVGEVLINGVKARVGSELGNMCGAAQVVLDRGERVFVFERVETPNDIDTPVWYKIAPPAGEFRFIRINALIFDRMSVNDTTLGHAKYDDAEQPKPLQMQSPITLVSDLQERRNTQTHRNAQGSSGPSALSMQVVPPASLPIPETLTGARNETAVQPANNVTRIASTQRPSTMPEKSRPNDRKPEHAVPNAIDIDDFREILEQLKVDLSEAVIEQETAVDSMQSLLHQSRMLYQAAPDANARAEVYRLIAGIERVTRVRRTDDETATAADHERQTRNRNDGRTMQLTAEKQLSETEPASMTVRSQSLSNKQKVDRPGTLPLPRLETAHMTAEQAYPDHIVQYSAQESFFDRDGQYYRTSASPDGAHRPYTSQQYANEEYFDRQNYEIYYDEQSGRYVDASGQGVDGQTLNEILHNAETVLMLDPNTGGYYEVSPQNMVGGHFANSENTMAYHQAAPQKSWVQRLVSGELFQNNDRSKNSQPNSQQYSPQYAQQDVGRYSQTNEGSGYAPYTYRLAYGDTAHHGFVQEMPQNQMHAQNGSGSSGTMPQATKSKGFFASSQPSLLVQQQQKYGRNTQNATRSNAVYRNDNMGSGPSSTGYGFPNGHPQGMLPGVMSQEFVLPDGVEMTGEGIVYDESQGINLLGDMQNLSQTDQLAFLIQHMAVPVVQDQGNMLSNMQGETWTNVRENASVRETPRQKLPLTDAEARLLNRSQATEIAPQQKTMHQTAARQEEPASPIRVVNHQVTGRLENGVGQVSADAFDVIGKLGRVKNAEDDMPKYALVDDTGKAICLVSSAAGVELEPHIKQTVGITGVQGSYQSDGKTFRHISAKAVYPITK